MGSKRATVELAVKQLRSGSKVPLEYKSLKDIYMPTHVEHFGMPRAESLAVSNLFGSVKYRRAKEHRIVKNRLKRIFKKYSEDPWPIESDYLALPYPERCESGLKMISMSRRMGKGDFSLMLVTKIIGKEQPEKIKDKIKSRCSSLSEESFVSCLTGEEIKAALWSLDHQGSVWDYWRARWKNSTGKEEKVELTVTGADLLDDQDTFIVSLLPAVIANAETASAIMASDPREATTVLSAAWEDIYGGPDGIDIILLGLSQPWKLQDEQREKYKDALELLTLLASFDLTESSTGSGGLLYVGKEGYNNGIKETS